MVIRLQMEQKKQLSGRSKLSKACFIKWLRTRFRNQKRKNNSYLYFPQDLVRETSMAQIFKEFDGDGSGGLSRDEVFKMFNDFGIPLTMDDLNRLYDSVQLDMEEMDCERFKKCALSEQSNRVFRDIVKGMGEGYLPHNFANMIIYLVYLSKREEFRRGIQKDNPIRERVAKVEGLLRLKDLTHNNERLNTHATSFKYSLKCKFRDIWEKINEGYGQKFPYTPKLEEEFYEYYRSSKQAQE